uniref:CNH domain-containing protein n=1 Tax=Anisakis simplex TaxID=6269 RepID=A0A0M3JGW2_ANISI
LAVVLKESAIVNVLAFNIEKLSFRKLCELSAVSNIVDVAFCKENYIVALSNDSVLFGEIRSGGGRLEVVQGTDEYLVNDLKEARDGLPCLEKKIGFDNMSEYRQRKLERIQNRKRKAEKVE